MTMYNVNDKCHCRDLCGLCGNYDGDKANELVDAFGNSVVPEQVTVVNRRGKARQKLHYTQLGNSWQVISPLDEPGLVQSPFHTLPTSTQLELVPLENI